MPVVEIPGRGNVEFPDSMSQEEILGKVKQFSASPIKPVNPYAGPAIQGADDPGKLERILGYANKNPVLSDEAKIGLVTPPGVGSLMGRIGMAGAAQGAGALARGEGLQGAAQGVLKGAAAQGTGEAIGAGVKGIRAMLPVGARGLAKYAADREGALAGEMKQSVPPMQDAKSLRDMFFSQESADKLHQFYDDSLKAVVERGKGQMIQVPEEAAKAFKLGGTGGTGQAAKDIAALRKILGARAGEDVLGKSIPEIGGKALSADAGNLVSVDAGDAAKAITGAWKKNPEMYRAVADALDNAGISDPAARAAYKTYMGFKNFVGELPGGKLNLVKAQERLTQPGPSAELLKRGLADKANSILNPTGTPVKEGSMRIPGAIVGGTLGSMLPGLGLYGHGAGLASGAWLGSHIGRGIPQYYNVPRTPINPDVSMLLNQYLQGALQQGFPKAQSTAP